MMEAAATTMIPGLPELGRMPSFQRMTSSDSDLWSMTDVDLGTQLPAAASPHPAPLLLSEQEWAQDIDAFGDDVFGPMPMPDPFHDEAAALPLPLPPTPSLRLGRTPPAVPLGDVDGNDTVRRSTRDRRPAKRMSPDLTAPQHLAAVKTAKKGAHHHPGGRAAWNDDENQPAGDVSLRVLEPVAVRDDAAAAATIELPDAPQLLWSCSSTAAAAAAAAALSPGLETPLAPVPAPAPVATTSTSAAADKAKPKAKPVRKANRPKKSKVGASSTTVDKPYAELSFHEKLMRGPPKLLPLVGVTAHMRDEVSAFIADLPVVDTATAKKNRMARRRVVVEKKAKPRQHVCHYPERRKYAKERVRTSGRFHKELKTGKAWLSAAEMANK